MRTRVGSSVKYASNGNHAWRAIAIEQRWKAVIGSELKGLWWGKLPGCLGGLVSKGKVADFVLHKRAMPEGMRHCP